MRGLLAPHKNLAAFGIYVEKDAGLVQHRADTAHILCAETAVERLKVRPAQEISDQSNRAKCRNPNYGQSRQATLAQRQDVLDQLLDLFSPDHENHPFCVDS